MTQPLQYPAPRRCSHQTEQGLYVTRAWTAEDIKLAESAGAWFTANGHDFAPSPSKAHADGISGNVKENNS